MCLEPGFCFTLKKQNHQHCLLCRTMNLPGPERESRAAAMRACCHRFKLHTAGTSLWSRPEVVHARQAPAAHCRLCLRMRDGAFIQTASPPHGSRISLSSAGSPTRVSSWSHKFQALRCNFERPNLEPGPRSRGQHITAQHSVALHFVTSFTSHCAHPKCFSN